MRKRAGATPSTRSTSSERCVGLFLGDATVLADDPAGLAARLDESDRS
ncbi:hypothetical protein [Amycolatopsis sp. WGS_07]